MCSSTASCHPGSSPMLLQRKLTKKVIKGDGVLLFAGVYFSEMDHQNDSERGDFEIAVSGCASMCLNQACLADIHGRPKNIKKTCACSVASFNLLHTISKLRPQGCGESYSYTSQTKRSTRPSRSSPMNHCWAFRQCVAAQTSALRHCCSLSQHLPAPNLTLD